MQTDLFISVIVPCFNEAAVVEETWARITTVFSNQINCRQYELIFVNDGSTDQTLDLLVTIAGKDPCTRVISFSRNFGHEAATTAGLNHCNGDVAFIIDADLQDPPELFPRLLDRMARENCNCVYGVRKGREGESFFKKLSSRLFYRFYNWIADIPFPVDTGDFRLIDRKIIDHFNKLTEKGKYVRGLLTWVGFRQMPFYYERASRQGGNSKYNFRQLLKLALNIIFSFTKKPLQLTLGLGALCVVVSLCLLIYIFISKWLAPLKGWASTLTVIVFFGGIQLITIGVLGQYIGIIFDEVKGRPEYIIDRIIENKKETGRN